MRRTMINLALPPDAELIARISAYDARWCLKREGNELVLYGNGAPAAFGANDSCDDWLNRLERAMRRARARRAARKPTKRALSKNGA